MSKSARQGNFRLSDLRAMGFQALLVTVGAQGTKWLGLPGENLDRCLPRQRPGVSLQFTAAFQHPGIPHW